VRVILRDNIDGLGRKGEICDVQPGYFRNFLNPNGKAFKATSGNVGQAEAMRRSGALRNAADRSDAEEVATALVPVVITISAKADGEHLYGSVSAADIATAIEEQTNVVIDRRALVLDHPIKEIGQSIVMCKLHPEVEFPVTVQVSGE
jgi:large subunit ribosomal protein L9